jgi:hypothetical protein
LWGKLGPLDGDIVGGFVKEKQYRTPNFKKEHECFACGAKCHTEWHHIKPRSEGGKNSRRNLIEICVPCHDQAEEFGWGWISNMYAERFGGFARSARAKKVRPSLTLKPGESLRYDPNERVWKVWGVDAFGIYAREV